MTTTHDVSDRKRALDNLIRLVPPAWHEEFLHRLIEFEATHPAHRDVETLKEALVTLSSKLHNTREIYHGPGNRLPES